MNASPPRHLFFDFLDLPNKLSNLNILTYILKNIYVNLKKYFLKSKTKNIFKKRQNVEIVEIVKIIE